MSSQTRNIFMTVIGVVVGFFILRWTLLAAIGLVKTLIPIALVVGLLYGGYQLFGKKALGGGRRTLP